MTTTFIISQVFVVLTYILLAVTYLLKKRKLVLSVGILSILCICTAYFLLDAWSGFAMNVIGIFRNLMFMWIDHKKEKTGKEYFGLRLSSLTVTYIAIIVFAVISYDGFLSLMSVFGAMVFSYSVWQKNPHVYRILGCVDCTLWIIYNIYVWSPFGILLEGTMLTYHIIMLTRVLIKHLKTKKEEKDKEIIKNGINWTWKSC